MEPVNLVVEVLEVRLMLLATDESAVVTLAGTSMLPEMPVEMEQPEEPMSTKLEGTFRQLQARNDSIVSGRPGRIPYRSIL